MVDISWYCSVCVAVNSCLPGHNGCHFTDSILKCFFLNENLWILITIYMKFIPESLINNIPALVQIMAWRGSGHTPLSEPMIAKFPDAYTDTAKLTGPRSSTDEKVGGPVKNMRGPIKLLYVIMFNILKSCKKWTFGPVKHDKFSQCLHICVTHPQWVKKLHCEIIY